VAQAHAKIADFRRHHLHDLTTQLVRNYDRICIEDLNVKGLARGFLAASIQDAAFGEFRRQLTYKCQWYGRELIVVNRYFASSKICWVCGWVNSNLTLSTRSWQCGGCHTVHDRDENAAKSIVAEGVRVLTARKARDGLPLEADGRSLPGCGSPGNGRRMREVTASEHPAPMTVLANEASTRKAVEDCLEPAAAA
jgi:IS605 OrfB family transposase